MSYIYLPIVLNMLRLVINESYRAQLPLVCPSSEVIAVTLLLSWLLWAHRQAKLLWKIKEGDLKGQLASLNAELLEHKQAAQTQVDLLHVRDCQRKARNELIDTLTADNRLQTEEICSLLDRLSVLETRLACTPASRRRRHLSAAPPRYTSAASVPGLCRSSSIQLISQRTDSPVGILKAVPLTTSALSEQSRPGTRIAPVAPRRVRFAV